VLGLSGDEEEQEAAETELAAQLSPTLSRANSVDGATENFTKLVM